MLKQIEEIRSLWIDGLVFVLLVALGVIGRHLTMDLPNFTPMAAIGIFAGFYFRRLSVALLVPFVAMAVSNAWLPTYNNLAMAVVCYAAFFFPVLLPKLMQRTPKIAQAISYGLAPAVVFFVVTNYAVWATDSMYDPRLAGLIECYTLAIPFFRTNLLGDVFYLAMLFGTYALVRATGPKLLPAAAESRF